MRTLLIAYDLAHPNRNRHAIATAIMGLGQAWARPLESMWYVRGDLDEEMVERALGSLLDSDDGLVVQCVSEAGAMTNTSLRWFRQRRSQLEIAPDSNIIAFPGAAPQPPAQAELPLATAVAG